MTACSKCLALIITDSRGREAESIQRHARVLTLMEFALQDILLAPAEETSRNVRSTHHDVQNLTLRGSEFCYIVYLCLSCCSHKKVIIFLFRINWFVHKCGGSPHPPSRHSIPCREECRHTER
jgi:hypothetical protein